jgi:hypothetical protein
LISREDVDVGGLHKKNHCVQLRVEKNVRILQHIKSTQLHLYNCALGVETATDDIADDVHCAEALLGKPLAMAPDKPSVTTLGFKADVHEAMSLESLDAIPMHYEFVIFKTL